MMIVVSPIVVNGSPIDVYIIAGQSNAEGFAFTDDLPPHLTWMQSPQNDITYRASTGTVTTLRPVLRQERLTMGPELTFGRTIKDANPGHDVAIIKYAVGSTSLETSWDPNTGTRYAGLMTRLGSTLSYLNQTGRSPNIKGLLWMQGEEDARWENMALNYRANLEELVVSLREDIQADLPIIIGQINAPGRPYRQMIRDAQQDIDMEGVRTIYTDDLPLQDKVHYGAVGQVALGIRFAAALDEASHELVPRGPILLNTVPEPSNFVTAVVVLVMLLFSWRRVL